MKRQLLTLTVIGISLLTAGCAEYVEPLVERQPLEEIQPTPPAPSEPGSLWTTNNTSLFIDQKAHQVGDVVTVLISEQASASKEAKTDTSRQTGMTANLSTIFGLENSKYFTDQKNPIDPTNLLDTDFNNSFTGEGSTSRNESLSASLTTQVVQTYPNGQLKIRGGKEVMVNNEVQVIYLTGIIRPADITMNNTVNSSQILNARISYTGKGAISDKQKPGWGMRILDNVWPF